MEKKKVKEKKEVKKDSTNKVINILKLNDIKNADKTLDKLSIGTIKELLEHDPEKIKRRSKPFYELLVKSMRMKGLFFNSDKESIILLNKIIKQSAMIEKMLTLIKDSGAYKDRKKYIMSDLELKEKIEEYFHYFLTASLNQIIAETIVVKLQGEDYFKELITFAMEALKNKMKNDNNIKLAKENS